MSNLAQKLIEKFESKLPEYVYADFGTSSVLWDHHYQRFDTAKKMVVLSLEQEIGTIESIRGAELKFHNGFNTVDLEIRIIDLHNLIKEIKSL